MLSQNLLVRTGNILNLNEAKTKASQNPTDEVSFQIFNDNICKLNFIYANIEIIILEVMFLIKLKILKYS